jgi:diacylglycerol kinase family enzyme
VELVETRKEGGAHVLAHQGVETGADVVAVYGGDGTLMQTVPAIVGTGTPIALIPGGTGNLVAGNLRIPRDPMEAARLITHGTPRLIDLGRLQLSNRERYFAVACGAGLDAEVMASTTAEAKRAFGLGAYVARIYQGLQELKGDHYRVTVDGEVIEMDAVTVIVANCGEFVPPFLRLGHGITFDDGLLDVVLLDADGVLQGVGVLSRLLLGLTDSPAMRFARGEHIVVESEPIRQVELDGEAAGGDTPFTASIVPKAIEIMVPGPDG